MNRTSELLDKLEDIVGSEHVLSREQVSTRATHFWDASPLEALALVRPKDTAQTAAIVKTCHEFDQPVVTHGGVTGLVDGNRSRPTDIILSLERQRTIETLDSVGRTITVQAGAILENVQLAANNAGLQFGLDLGARGSCTIGGNLSTNAGGLSVLRYGMAREQVLGIEVVTADGSIVSSMNTLLKNNAGYDLKHLFIGSEGTLGIITRAVLRLRAPTPAINTAILAFEGFDKITDTLAYFDQKFSGTLNAFEVLWQSFYQLNTNVGIQNSIKPPISARYPFYAIVETRSANAESDQVLFQTVLESAFEQKLITDATIAQSEKERSNIWFIREHIDSALANDPVFTYDISLPISAMDQYITQLQYNLNELWPNNNMYVYGHLADSNLHILVAPSTTDGLTDNDRRQWHKQSDTLVYEPLQALGGSVSAEHGIGLYKKEYLPLSRNKEEIRLMKLLKKTLDPKGILNPGKIIIP